MGKKGIKFVNENVERIIAYEQATMFRRMMEIESQIEGIVERHLINDENSIIGNGYRYYLPKCKLYLDLIVYSTGLLHIECLKGNNDKSDDMLHLQTVFEVEICKLSPPIYIHEPEDSNDENIQKLLYWIQRGFGKIVDLREIYHKNEE